MRTLIIISLILTTQILTAQITFKSDSITFDSVYVKKVDGVFYEFQYIEDNQGRSFSSKVPITDTTKLLKQLRTELETAVQDYINHEQFQDRMRLELNAIILRKKVISAKVQKLNKQIYNIKTKYK
jgi:hypothetical protein